MFYSHRRNQYTTKDPIPLSENTIPVIELQTKETEYKGVPYSDCIGPSKYFTKPLLTSEFEKYANNPEIYDITTCNALRIMQNIIKRMCLKYSFTHVWPCNNTYMPFIAHTKIAIAILIFSVKM